MNKVFILGAGASKPAGAPLISEFFEEGFFHLIHGSASPDSLKKYTNFLDYLRNVFKFDINNPDPYKSEPFAFVDNTGINIEQILSSIDEEIQNGNKNLIKVKKEAERFVYLTLENAVIDGSVKNCYPDFVNKKLAPYLNDDHTIITFNYEMIFEKALLDNNLTLASSFSYGLDIDRNRIINFPGYEKFYKNNFLILKLHGSLNWGICPSCCQSYLFWHNSYDRIVSEECNKCKDTNIEPILIPPTKYKNRNKTLRKLWDAADQKLFDADEITIIGYSFNEYDEDAVSLIKDSIEANSKNPKLYIVDVNPDGIYQKIFSNCFLEERHFSKIISFAGFREYLDNKVFISHHKPLSPSS